MLGTKSRGETVDVAFFGGWPTLSRRGGENGWEACSWPEPTLPQKAREGWGNRVRNVEWKGWALPGTDGWRARGQNPPSRKKRGKGGATLRGILIRKRWASPRRF